jgi:predicted Ser/Thr protein kinase
MKSIRKALLRRKKIKQNYPTMARIQELLSEHMKRQIHLKPGFGKRGQDEIYSALDGRKVVAMVRVENKNQLVSTSPPKWAPPKWDFRVRLDFHKRIEKEWNAYSMLSKKNLSPATIWRNEIAAACTFIDGERASRRFVQVKKEFWELTDTVFKAVKQMHDCNIIHLDLNLGNILITKQTNDIAIIDFEFGPADWLSIAQQRACDFL